MHVTLGSLFWMLPGLTSCGPVCSTDLDCDSETELSQCVDGSCVPLDVDVGPSCESDEDCDQETGASSCVEGSCALRPQCQQIFGDFDYVARFSGDLQRGIAQVTTVDCSPRLTFDFEVDREIQLPTIDAQFGSDERTLGATPDGQCDASSWTPKSSTISASCLFEGDASQMVLGLVASSLELSPCLLDDTDADGCVDGTTCMDTLGNGSVGVCQ